MTYNYCIKRDDGAAAEIFHEQKPKYLFVEMVKNIPEENRSKKKLLRLQVEA
jgi:hypothetical protein